MSAARVSPCTACSRCRRLIQTARNRHVVPGPPCPRPPHLSSVLWLSSCTCWMLLLCKLLAVASCRNPITSGSCCWPHGWLPPVCTTIRMLRLLSLLRWLLVRSKLLVLLLPRLRLAASRDNTAVDALQAACAAAETHRSSRAAPVLVACAAGPRPSTCSLRHVRLISAWALSASAAALLVPSGCSRITAWAASAATRSRLRALEGWPDLQKRRSWCWLLPLNTAVTAASSTGLLGSASTTMGCLYSLLWLSACAWLSCLRREGGPAGFS